MSNQINEGAARYTADKQDQSRPVLSDNQETRNCRSREGGDLPKRSAAQGTQSPQQLVTDHLDLWTSTITPKSTSGRGSNNKIELTGIKKLRELILELAVRGKLVAQNPDDEPASKLLERIEAEKAQLIKDGKLKKQKPLAPVSEDEKPFALPEGWEWVKLGNLLSFEYGDNLPQAKRSNSGEYPVYGSNGVVGTHNVAFVSAPCIVIGRKGSAGALNLSLTSGCCVTDVAYYCIPSDSLNLRFIFKLLHTSGLDSLGKGIKPGLNRTEAYQLIIALPPLAEQQRIVAKVDELMALCDQLEQQSEHQLTAHQQLTDTLLGTLLQPAAGALTESADATTKSSQKEQLNDNWQRLANHFDLLFSGPMGAWAIDRLKDTILQLAVMGKLVPQNPDDEPASKLLEHIEEEKARLVKEGKIKKPKKLPPVSDEEKPFELPEGWEWCRLSTLVTALGDGLHGTPTYDSYGKYFFVNGNNLKDGKIDIKPDTKKVSFEEYHKHQKPLDENTVLVSINGTLGNVGFYNNEPVMLGKSACYFNLMAELTKLYFKRLLESQYFLEYANRKATGSTIKNLGLKAMHDLPIAMPPTSEQQRIVEKVDELFALCDQLKERLQQASETEQHLTNAIVEQALG